MIEKLEDLFIGFDCSKELKRLFGGYPMFKPKVAFRFWVDELGTINFSDRSLPYQEDFSYPSYVDLQIMEILSGTNLPLHPLRTGCYLHGYFCGERLQGDEVFTGKDYSAKLLLFLEEKNWLSKIKFDE